MKSPPLIQNLAFGFQEGGIGSSFNYPGFHANELHDALGGGPTSINERTAYAMAWGYSLASGRALVSFKNVGLNDAADPFLASVQLGCNGGLVLALFEDCDLQHSQNRMDSRPYFDFFGGLWFEPRTLSEARNIARDSFRLSETFSVPVVIRLTNILYHHPGPAIPPAPPQPQGPELRPFHRNPARWLAHPTHAAAQEKQRIARQTNIQDWVETRFESDPTHSATPSRILFGAPRDVPVTDAIRLDTLPLPMQGLRTRLKSDQPLPVYEHGHPYVAEKLRGLHAPAFPAHSMNNCRLRFKHHNRDACEPLYSILRENPNRCRIGDLGEYTRDPQNTLDACLCYGASVAVAGGFKLARPEMSVWAVTGDGAFAHAGSTALEELQSRNLPVRIIVMDNGGCRGTGGQSVPGGICRLEGFQNVFRISWPEIPSQRDFLATEPMNGPELILLHNLPEI